MVMMPFAWYRDDAINTGAGEGTRGDKGIWAQLWAVTVLQVPCRGI